MRNAPSEFEHFKPQRLSTENQRPTKLFRHFRFKNSGQVLEYRSTVGVQIDSAGAFVGFH